MGDRGEVQFSYGLGKGDIFLYTHWTGYRLPHTLRDALVFGKGRWSDQNYLTRICVSQIVGEEWSSELGYGLAPYHFDSEYPALICDVDGNTVTINSHTYGFSEYVELTDEQLEKLWGVE